MGGMTSGDRLRVSGHMLASVYRRTIGRAQHGGTSGWPFAARAPGRVLVAPRDLRTGDPVLGDDILRDRFMLDGRPVDARGASVFTLDMPSNVAYQDLFGFGWLRHLRAARSERANARARMLVQNWLEHCGTPRRPGWEPEVTARRILAWLSHSPVVLQTADHGFYRRFMSALARNEQHLRNTANHNPESEVRLTCVIALMSYALCVPRSERAINRMVSWLTDALKANTLLDGGVPSRRSDGPAILLLDLLPLRQTFVARAVPVPDILTHTIDRLMPMVRFFRHPNGEVANFNGAGPYTPDMLGTLLTYDDVRGRPVPIAQHSGYVRADLGKAMAIMDVGAPPPLADGRRAHARALTLAFSPGPRPPLVTCTPSVHSALRIGRSGSRHRGQRVPVRHGGPGARAAACADRQHNAAPLGELEPHPCAGARTGRPAAE